MALQNIFTTVCNMTLTASIVIGCVLLARLALKKAPRVFSYVLWTVVLFRLLCPVSLPSPVSVLNVVEAPRSELGTIEYLEPPVQTPLETVIPIDGGLTAAPSAPVSVEAPPDWNLIGTWVWLVVACGLLGYGFLSYVNLKRKLRESIPAEPGVREIDAATTPFVLGLLRPVIYLPAGMEKREREYILLHERFHVRHFDPQVRAVFFAAVCLHWFNPLVWLAFRLCGRDMEMRCDEAVLKRLGSGVRSDYAQSLLNFATGRYALAAPLAFGEGDTGKRVRNVLNWKKKAGWMLVLATMVCAAVFLMTGCDPAQEPESPFGHSYRATHVISSGPIDEVVMTYEFTLTSDQVVYVNDSAVGDTGLVEVAEGTPHPVTMPEGTMKKALKSWKSPDDRWWLFDREDGLWLWCEGEYLVKLQRVDLLGVTVRQPGIESYIEPAWFSGEAPDWLAGSLSSTGVDDAAELIFDFETEVDSILVSEQYFERLEDGEFSIVTTDTVLHADEGGFVLNVARRGSVGDDHAIYTVQAGEQCYQFRLHFPVIPGETSYSHVEEETTRTVEFSENGAYIRLQLPESWEYSLSSLGENENAAGISFWPSGYSEERLSFEYYPNRFGVCGTDLEETDMILGGRTVWVGTYGQEPIWSFISLGDNFAVWGGGHEVWWDEYGDTAMEILETAEFGFTE